MAGTRGEQRHPEPALITNAAQGTTREFEARRRHYMIAMGIRTLCFLASTILYFTHLINVWVCAIIFIAAVVLPSVAVAVANQANTRKEDLDKFATAEPSNARQLTTGPEPEVVSGTVEDEYGTVPPDDEQTDDQAPHGQAHHRGAA